MCFTTPTALVDELVEACAANALSRALGRWEWLELSGRTELGCVPHAERLLQVIAARAARAAVIVTTDLPFSERGQVFPDRRPGRAPVDRRTDRADIIETGIRSFRFRRTRGGSRNLA